MMMTLAVMGAALIIFGAIVLVKFSDRPGGSIKALGAEVSSAGAGLPLIALGVGCIGWAATHWPQSVPSPSGEPTGLATSAAVVPATPRDTGCVAALLAPAAGRVDTVETGMQGVEVVGAHERLDLPFAIVLTDNGQPVGIIRARLYRANNASADLYKVEEAVDARCAPVTSMANGSRGGNPKELINWDTLRITLGAHKYDIRIGGEGNISVAVTRAA
jgi:hypothetical protein